VKNTEEKIKELKAKIALLDSQIGLADFEIEDLQIYEEAVLEPKKINLNAVYSNLWA